MAKVEVEHSLESPVSVTPPAQIDHNERNTRGYGLENDVGIENETYTDRRPDDTRTGEPQVDRNDLDLENNPPYQQRNENSNQTDVYWSETGDKYREDHSHESRHDGPENQT